MSNRTIKYIYQLVDKLSPSMRKMAKVATTLTRSLRGTGKEADKANTKLNRLARTMRSMRTMKMGLGGMFAGAGTGILMRKIGSTIVDYDKSMRMVQANMVAYEDSGGNFILKGMDEVQDKVKASDDMMQRLHSKVQDVAQKSIFDPTEVAGGLLELARAGVTAEQSLAMLHPVMRLAGAAGNISAAQAADIATNITMSFGGDLAKTTKVVDILAAAASAANLDIQKLGESMKMAAPSAFTAGRGLKEVTATLMVFASRGFKGGMAGVTLARMIDSIYKRTGPAVKALKSIGLAHKDFMGEDGNTIPITEMLDKFKEAAKVFGREKVIMAINTMMGARGGRGGKLLMNEAEAIKLKVLWLLKAQGRAALMEKIMMSGIYGAYEKMRASIAQAMISLGDGGLTADLLSLATTVKDLANSFSRLSPDTKQLVGRILLLVTALSAVIIPVGIFLWALGALGAFFMMFISPLGLIIVALGALLTWLGKSYDVDLDDVVAGFKWLGDAIQHPLDTLERLASKLASFTWSSLKDGIQSLFPKMILEPVGPNGLPLQRGSLGYTPGPAKTPITDAVTGFSFGSFFDNWRQATLDFENSKTPVTGTALAQSQAEKEIAIKSTIESTVTLTAPDSITVKSPAGENIGLIPLGATSDKGRTQVDSAASP